MSGRSAPRSRNGTYPLLPCELCIIPDKSPGCLTCRTRKVKCDEVRPSCSRCRTAQLACEWLPSPERRSQSRPKRTNPSTALAAIQSRRLLLPRDMFGFSANNELSNSLHLTVMDREYLMYFPRSTLVKWVGKPWQWAFLRHLYGDVASRSPVVMRLILANAASELEGRKATDPELAGLAVSKTRGTGAAHYGAALREFGAMLEQCLEQKRPLTKSAIDEIVASFFFMISYERHFEGRDSGLAAHLSGVQAFLETCGVFSRQTGELKGDVSEMAKNLLLFIMWAILYQLKSGTKRTLTPRLGM